MQEEYQDVIIADGRRLFGPARRFYDLPTGFEAWATNGHRHTYSVVDPAGRLVGWIDENEATLVRVRP